MSPDLFRRVAAHRRWAQLLGAAFCLSLIACGGGHSGDPAVSSQSPAAVLQTKAIQSRYALTQVDPKGWVAPYAQPLSEDGSVAALRPRYSGDTAGDPFFWSAASGVIDFPPKPLAATAYLTQINSAGVVVGALTDTSSRRLPSAISWSPGTGQITLPRFSVSGQPSASFGLGVNRSGLIVGYVAAVRTSDASPPLQQYAAYWTGPDGALGLMNDDPLLHTTATAVNDAGQAVGRVTDSGTEVSQGFIWDSAQGMQRIPLPDGATGGDAVAIGQAGHVVTRAFYTSPSGERYQRASLWTSSGGAQPLEHNITLDPNDSFLNAPQFRVSDSGSIVSNVQINSRPFYWQPGSGFLDILGSNGTAGQAKAISRSGAVVGWYQQATEGRQTAFAWSEAAGFVNLNDRIDSASGIYLEDAIAITESGYILAVADGGLVLLSPQAASSAPVTGAIEGADPIAAAASASFTVNFTDPDTWDSHTAEWNWGDGSAAEAATITFANGAGTASGNHAYAAAGIYDVTLTLRDAAGGSSQSTRKVVVYDPNAGYVAGVGFFTSPPGAHKGKPTTAGRAEFTFVARYLGQGNAPTGATVFRFSAGAMNFVSIRNDWLVVSGSRAQFQGVGRLNGVNDHRFVLTAIDVDGARFSLRSKDRIRMQVWSPAGELVYDNNDPGTTGDEGSLVSGGAIEVVAR